jgi:hypothetical protein
MDDMAGRRIDGKLPLLPAVTSSTLSDVNWAGSLIQDQDELT